AFGAVWYFDLRSATPHARHRVAWSRPEGAANDTTQARSLTKLQRRLTPLRPDLEEALPSWGSPPTRDTVVVLYGPVARYTVHASFADGTVFRCVTYSQPDVCARAVYTLPGRVARLWILAFRGDPNDPVERDVAVLVRPSELRHEIPVAWTRAEFSH